MKKLFALLLFAVTCCTVSGHASEGANCTTGKPCGLVTIYADNLPAGTVGQAYSGSISAEHGCEPYKWMTLSGAPPAGLTLAPSSNTSQFLITGTPTTAESSSFTVEVIGCGGHKVSDTYTITIALSGSTPPPTVALKWNASTNATSYNVYRALEQGGRWDLLNSTAATAFTDSTVVAGSTYFYVVTALGAEGESGHSDEVSAATPH
jgi:Putative Ig domain